MNNDITAAIKAFKRPEKMKKTIDYALAAGVEKILVGYDGADRYYSFHKRIIDRYDDKVQMYKYDYNIGISYVRNRLLEMTKTKYFFLLDDDHYLHPKVLDVIPYLDKHKDIGVVAFPYYIKNEMRFMNWCFNVEIKDHEVLPTTPNIKIDKFNDIYIAKGMDTLENCAIFKTDMLREMKGWDEHYIIEGEHMDFYLDRKFNYPHWKLASALNIYTIHDLGPGYFLYNDTRWSGDAKEQSVEFFKKKWDVKEALGLGRNLYKDNPELLNYKKYYLKNEVNLGNIFNGGKDI